MLCQYTSPALRDGQTDSKNWRDLMNKSLHNFVAIILWENLHKVMTDKISNAKNCIIRNGRMSSSVKIENKDYKSCDFSYANICKSA